MSNIAISQRTNESIYLEYLNEWESVKEMAENYGRTIWGMQFLINAGRDEHIQNLSKKTNKMNKTTEYWRNPTEREIKFGEGAIHWLTVETDTVTKKDGNLKKWFINPADGLRYNR